MSLSNNFYDLEFAYKHSTAKLLVQWTRCYGSYLSSKQVGVAVGNCWKPQSTNPLSVQSFSALKSWSGSSRQALPIDFYPAHRLRGTIKVKF